MQHTKLAIVGSGPAGYTAGIYSSRAELSPIIFAGINPGGQLMYTTEVENYPGFSKGTMGVDLMAEMREQSIVFGAKIVDTFVTAIDFSQRPFQIWTTLLPQIDYSFYETAKREEVSEVVKKIKGKLTPTHSADSLILSTGAVSKMTGVKGEDEFLGRGVSTCATCDAAFFKEKDVLVVGGGDSAMEDSLSLIKFAKSITILNRGDKLKASKVMQDRVINHPKVTVMWNTSLKEIRGEKFVEAATISRDGELEDVSVQGIFIAIGHTPMTSLFSDDIALDDHGYIITPLSFSRLGTEFAKKSLDKSGLMSFPSMTNISGVFAAGDVVDIRYKQAVTAAGNGCMASLDAERWLEIQENN